MKGVDIARKYKLPPMIIDFIRTHQGTTLAYFFYKKYFDNNPGKKDLGNFSYPGPQTIYKGDCHTDDS